MTRRDLLASAVAIGVARVASAKDKDPYAPFRMGIQSYSLRGLKTPGALAMTRRLGLSLWEAWEGHLPLGMDTVARSEARMTLRASRIQVGAFGVVGFGADAESNRRKFEFASAMGIPILSADPSREALPSLEELTEEFGIRIAIHNHGPGSRYDKVADVESALGATSNRIGACVDTGHFLRSGEDPVKAVERLGRRVYGVHLKDVKDGKTFMELGKGDLDVAGVLRALARSGFSDVLALEYEEHPDDPEPHLAACLAEVRRAVSRI